MFALKQAPLTIAACACLALGAASSHGAIVEDWQSDDAGDDLSELANWTAVGQTAAAGGAIADISGNKRLEFASMAADSTRTVEHLSTHELGSHNIIEVTLTMQDLTSPAGPGGFMVVDSATDQYRVEYNAGSNGTLNFKRNGLILTGGAPATTASIRTALDDASWGLSTASLYKLTITLDDDSTDLAVSINNVNVLSYSDTSTDRLTFADGDVKLRLYAWQKNAVAFDDVSLTSVPEPATAALGSLLAAGMLLGRRRA